MLRLHQFASSARLSGAVLRRSTTSTVASAFCHSGIRSCASATATSNSSNTAAASSSSAVATTAGSALQAPDGKRGGRGGKWDDDPALEEIDYSVPQVNCAFVADLLAKRKAEQRKQWGDLAAARGLSKEKKKQAQAQAEEEGKTSAAGAKNKKDGDDNDAAAAAEEDENDPDLQIDDDVNLALHPSDGVLLLDLRTVAEVSAWGTIEGSKILPMHEFYDAMHLEPADFYEQYGFDKPGYDTTILFYCQHGPRSLMAAQIAYYLGYKNVIHLRSGYFEWCKQYYLLCRRWMVHDHTTGIDNHRLTEFAAARHIAQDIASEFNEIVDAETALIRIDHSRSMGTIELPIPEKIQQLSASFEAERERLELEEGDREQGRRQLQLEQQHMSLPETATGADGSMTTAVDRKVAKGDDPVLTTALEKEISELEQDEARMRRDYTSEAAKVLRRRRAGERTGVPESYYFRRKEQPHGTGR